MALTLAGEVPDPAALPETAFHLPRLPFVPFAEMGSAALAEQIAVALTEGPEPCQAPWSWSATVRSPSVPIS